jgi:hypothetical protein
MFKSTFLNPKDNCCVFLALDSAFSVTHIWCLLLAFVFFYTAVVSFSVLLSSLPVIAGTARQQGYGRPGRKSGVWGMWAWHACVGAPGGVPAGH